VPMYRAAHRQSSTATAIRLRPPRSRRPTMADDLARPEALASAIELDQLRLFYHPIVHLAGTTLVGHEVLIRWQHPDYGLLSPTDFLPAINESEVLSRVLGAWVLRQSCAAAGQREEQLVVSINIAARHLAEPSFAEHVTQILRVTGFAPNRLILEISELSARAPSATVIGTCLALTDLGVTIALADFGTGEMTEDQLDGLPLGILKIDRSIVGGIGTDIDAERLILRMLELAAASGRETIAVGVESHEQARFLRTHEATFAQGYLYGRPQPR
jgi:EAL domain-containing protein (putative c-di-GMP-specific phosphodiesterase class I)